MLSICEHLASERDLYSWLYVSREFVCLSCMRYIMGRDMIQPTNWMCAQRRLRSAWASAQSDQSLRWRRSLATHWADSEDSDQTGQMPRLIWVFAGRTLIWLVLSCRGSCHFSLPLGVIGWLLLMTVTLPGFFHLTLWDYRCVWIPIVRGHALSCGLHHLSHVARKPVFGSLQPCKTQTGQLSYID